MRHEAESVSLYALIQWGLQEHTERQLAALAQSPSFAAGDRVAHAIFGEGTIEEIDPEAAVYTIRFDDIPTPRRISFRVPLRKCGS